MDWYFLGLGGGSGEGMGGMLTAEELSKHQVSIKKSLDVGAVKPCI